MDRAALSCRSDFLGDVTGDHVGTWRCIAAPDSVFILLVGSTVVYAGGLSESLSALGIERALTLLVVSGLGSLVVIYADDPGCQPRSSQLVVSL